MRKKRWEELWKKAGRKAGCIILTAAIITSLTACGNGSSGESEKNNNLVQSQKGTEKAKQTESEQTESEQEYVYQPFFQKMNTKSTSFSYMCELDDYIYMIGNRYEENEETGEYIKHTYLVECTADGNNQKETELELEKDEYINAMTVNKNNQLYILTYTSSYNEKTQESKSNYYLKTLEKDGTIKEDHEIQMKEENQQSIYLGGRTTVLTENGSIYTCDMNNIIYYFDENGKQKKSYDVKNSIDNIVSIQDEIYIFGSFGKENSYAVRKLNTETQKLEEAKKVGEVSIYNAESYGSKDGMVYMENQDALYLIDIAAGKTDVLLTWINGDIDGNQIRTFLPLEDGSFLALLTPWNTEEAPPELALIKKVKASDRKEKKVLTFACTYLSFLKEAIIDFNKTNENYRIEVKDYSSYGEDYTTRLNLDIISGQVPDILSLNMLPVNVYINKGILTDLYPLMEKDSEIKKEDFIDSIINTLEQDGKLYYIGSTFSVDALTVGKKYLKDTEGFSFKEMQELYKSKSKQQVFFYYMAREWFLDKVICNQINDFINWDTKEVSMDSENFIDMLEFSNNFPSSQSMVENEIDLEKAVKKGNIMLMDFSLYQASNIELYTYFYKNAKGFQIINYPSEDKSDRIAINFANPAMAITEQCEDKEGAWEFIRYFLTYDKQLQYANSYSGLPIRKDAFEKLLEYSMATESYTDENGMKVEPVNSSYYYNVYEVPIGPINEEEADILRAMVDRIGAISAEADAVTSQIKNIITEEVRAFYAGDKTAKEAAEIIQNRVQLFVNENS